MCCTTTVLHCCTSERNMTRCYLGYTDLTHPPIPEVAGLDSECSTSCTAKRQPSSSFANGIQSKSQIKPPPQHALASNKNSMESLLGSYQADVASASSRTPFMQSLGHHPQAATQAFQQSPFPRPPTPTPYVPLTPCQACFPTLSLRLRQSSSTFCSTKQCFC